MSREYLNEAMSSFFKFYLNVAHMGFRQFSCSLFLLQSLLVMFIPISSFSLMVFDSNCDYQIVISIIFYCSTHKYSHYFHCNTLLNMINSAIGK